MVLTESLGFRVVASSYGEEVKAALGQLVNVLGGEVSLRLSRRNTHLLVPCAVGDKYLGCADRGVTPVTMEWLLQSAQAGGDPLNVHGDPQCWVMTWLLWSAQAGGRRPHRRTVLAMDCSVST